METGEPASALLALFDDRGSAVKVTNHGVSRVFDSLVASAGQEEALRQLTSEGFLSKLLEHNKLDVLQWMKKIVDLKHLLGTAHPHLIAKWAGQFSHYNESLDDELRTKQKERRRQATFPFPKGMFLPEVDVSGILMLHFFVECCGYATVVLHSRETHGGNGVLHNLARRNRMNLVTYLLRCGASDPSMVDWQGACFVEHQLRQQRASATAKKVRHEKTEERTEEEEEEHLKQYFTIDEVPVYERDTSWKDLVKRALAQPNAMNGYTPVHCAIDALEYRTQNCAYRILRSFLKMDEELSKNVLVPQKLVKSEFVGASGGATVLMHYVATAHWFDDRIPTMLIDDFGAELVGDTDNDGRGLIVARCAHPRSGDTHHELGLLDYLFDKGAHDNIFLKKETQKNALHYAASLGKGRLVKRLLEAVSQQHGALIIRRYCLACDDEGFTPLHLACHYRSTGPRRDQVVQLLAAACPEALTTQRQVASSNTAGILQSTPWSTLLDSPIDKRSEKFYMDWDKRRKGCVVAREHTAGGKPALYLALALATDGEIATLTKVDKWSEDAAVLDRIAEDVDLTRQFEIECGVNLKPSKKHWPKRFERLVEICKEADVKKRCEMYEEVEKLNEAEVKEREEDKKKALMQKQKEKRAQERKETLLFVSAIVVVVLYLFRGYVAKLFAF